MAVFYIAISDRWF